MEAVRPAGTCQESSGVCIGIEKVKVAPVPYS